MNLLTEQLIYNKNGFPIHHHSDYEIIIYQKGAGYLRIPGQDIPIKAGTIIIIPPGLSHRSVMEDHLQSIYINGPELNHFFNFSAPVTLTDNEQRDGCHLAGMIYRNRYEDSTYLAALYNAFIHFILKNIKMDNNVGYAVRRIIQNITDNFHDANLNLCSLLTESGYAEDYIRSHFKKNTGKTPTAFLTDVRIRHACHLIDVYKDTVSLTEIAEQCGYADYVYFSRKFKTLIGISPQKYRDRL